MNDLIRPAIAIIVAIVFQITLIPAFLADPLRPNLLLVTVVWLGLSAPVIRGVILSYLMGLVQDCVSGLYLGLNAFSYLVAFLVLNNISHRLYTDSRYLITIAVFSATLASGILQMLMLILFSSADGVYASFLISLIPQALVNSLAASLLFDLFESSETEAAN
jgi:rod shape-determining protein MreD